MANSDAIPHRHPPETLVILQKCRNLITNQALVQGRLPQSRNRDIPEAPAPRDHSFRFNLDNLSISGSGAPAGRKPV